MLRIKRKLKIYIFARRTVNSWKHLFTKILSLQNKLLTLNFDHRNRRPILVVEMHMYCLLLLYIHYLKNLQKIWNYKILKEILKEEILKNYIKNSRKNFHFERTWEKKKTSSVNCLNLIYVVFHCLFYGPIKTGRLITRLLLKSLDPSTSSSMWTKRVHWTT